MLVELIHWYYYLVYYRLHNLADRVSYVASFQHASDAVYEKYRCPVFKGFVVCVSGMASDDRNSVRTLVEHNGQNCIYLTLSILILLQLSAVQYVFGIFFLMLSVLFRTS